MINRDEWLKSRAYDIWEFRMKLGLLPRDPAEDWYDAEFEWEQHQEHIRLFHEQFNLNQ